MHPRKQAILDLEESGYTFYREGKKHEIYKNQSTGEIIPLKRHDFNENDLKYIRKEIKQKESGRG